MSPAPEKGPVSAASAAAPILYQLKEVRSQITRTQRIVFMGAGLFGLALLAGFVMIHLPWAEQRNRLNVQLQEETERVDLLLAIQGQRLESTGLEGKFLLEGGPTALTGQVSRLAADAGLQIESVTPQPETLMEPYAKYQLEVVATSNVFNLLRFVRSLERHEPQFSLDELEVGQSQAETGGAAMPFDTILAEPKAFKEPEQQRLRLLIGAISKPRSPP